MLIFVEIFFRSIKLYKKALLKKNEDCFFYLRYLMSVPRKEVHLWKDLLSVFTVKEIKSQAEALHYFYTKMTHAEKPIYLYHAMLLCLHEKSFDVKDVIDRDNTITNENVALIKTSVSTFNGKFDDYVYDMHTSGNRKKKDRITFATEGALIPNECTTYLNTMYRSMYIDFKKLQII